MSDSAHIQRDWVVREATEGMRLSLLELTSFMSKFGMTSPSSKFLFVNASEDSAVRERLGVLNERLARLDRQVEHLEAALIAGTDEAA